MFDEAAGELIIGGIYLRLFIQQPAWVSSQFLLLIDFHYELQALQALLFVPERRSCCTRTATVRLSGKEKRTILLLEKNEPVLSSSSFPALSSLHPLRLLNLHGFMFSLLLLRRYINKDEHMCLA